MESPCWPIARKYVTDQHRNDCDRPDHYNRRLILNPGRDQPVLDQLKRAHFEPLARVKALSCHYAELASRDSPSMVALVLDDNAATDALGKPNCIVECSGVASYSYDPPIRLDYRNVAVPDLTRVGEAF